MRRLLLVLPLLSMVGTGALADGDAIQGEKVFMKCKACHTADQPTNRVGPTLKGVVGRKVAAVESYNYSDAMKKKGESGAIWDEGNLAIYLADPKAFIPGTKMAFAGLKKPTEVADLIAYLKTKQ